MASTLTLQWQRDLQFRNGPDSPPIELHSSTPGVPSPMQALAYSLMACTGMDVAHVLQKGRQDFTALTITFHGERAQDHPRRYTAIRLHFDVTGTVADDVVARAITLSREKYCSVSASLRPDIPVTTTFAVHRP